MKGLLYMQAIRTRSTYRLTLVLCFITTLALLSSLWVLMEVVSLRYALITLFDQHVICRIGPMEEGDLNGLSSEIPLENSTAPPSKPGLLGSESLEMYRRDKNPS